MTGNTGVGVPGEDPLAAAPERVDEIGALAAAVGAPLPLVRVGAGMLEERTCQRFNWIKANVAHTVQRPRRRPEQLSSFLLEPLFKVLDMVETNGRSVSDALEMVRQDGRLHEAEKRWIANAAAVYPDLPSAGFRPVRGWWIVRGNVGHQTRELYTWGRAYATQTGEQRLLVLPTIATASRRELHENRVSAAAYTTAFGQLAEWPKPRQAPFRKIDDPLPAPSRVIVRQVGLLDGSVKDVFDGTPTEAGELYAASGRAAATAITTSTRLEPGRDCDSCRLLDECAGVPRAPGLLGVSDPGAPLRSLSATTLRYHRACPQQARLFDLKLSTSREETSAVRVGRAVDEVLNTVHGVARQAPCTREELHAILDENGDLTPGERRRGAQLLDGHEQTCPWASSLSIDDVRSQAEVVAFDPAASVVIHAAPDLLFREDRAVVWRETTSGARSPRSTTPLLTTFKSVQLALAVLLMARGVLGRDIQRIEVEYLTDQGPDVRFLDPGDPDVVAEATEIIRPLAASWRHDQLFSAIPGDACRSCAYTAWCPVSVQTEVRSGASD